MRVQAARALARVSDPGWELCEDPLAVTSFGPVTVQQLALTLRPSARNQVAMLADLASSPPSRRQLPSPVRHMCHPFVWQKDALSPLEKSAT